MEKVIIGNATLYRTDCFDVLPELERAGIDAVVTDPPYGCTCNDWDVGIDWEKFWERALPCLKPNAALCVFSQQPFTTDLIMSNRKLFRYDIIWSKQIQVGFLNAKKMPLRAHEHICVFYQKIPTYNPQKYYRDRPSYRKADVNRKSSNYGKFDRTRGYGSMDGSRYPGSIVYVDYETLFFKKTDTPRHPTQKPLDIMEYLVKTYTNPGNMVLDPFMGSGTTGVAAVHLGRKFVGIEKDPQYYDIACKRIEEAQYKKSLFETMSA